MTDWELEEKYSHIWKPNLAFNRKNVLDIIRYQIEYFAQNTDPLTRKNEIIRELQNIYNQILRTIDE